MSLSAAVDQLRVGEFTFLNCGLLRWGRVVAGSTAVAPTAGSPPRIAAALLRGDLDLAPLSLLEYLQHIDEFLVLPGLAIGSDGPVLSCQLISRGPLDRLDRRPVSLCSTSRTAALLGRILLEDAVDVRPTYTAAPPVLTEMLRSADAGVLIGDPALQAACRPPAGLRLHDLGELWREWTGLPMVFALWVVRREVAARRPDAVRAAFADVLGAARRGLADLPAAAAALSDAAPATVTEPDLIRYFRTLSFDLGDRQLAGVEHFARLAARRVPLPEARGSTFFDQA